MVCDAEITTDSLYISLCSMRENKTPGNHGLSKEFYMKFWEKLKKNVTPEFDEGKEKRRIVNVTEASCYKAFRKEREGQKTVT